MVDDEVPFTKVQLFEALQTLQTALDEVSDNVEVLALAGRKHLINAESRHAVFSIAATINKARMTAVHSLWP
ncbi:MULTISPECIES: hypothetical protein [unclassified Caballeronia]|uniref:hypothetical protein n=1 Tax=unclassified Caballeronia TaxID=2646786 RepID=UPI0020294032|nr:MULTISPECIES: hypothetical protein [unclassified Caballeronia]